MRRTMLLFAHGKENLLLRLPGRSWPAAVTTLALVAGSVEVVERAVIGANERQEPRRSEVARHGTPAQVAQRVGGRVAGDGVRHRFAHHRRQLRAASAVTHR